MKQQKLITGNLLLSEPISAVEDALFTRSVVLLAEHNPKGSVGFILNKPLDICLKDILPEAFHNLKIYNGGPVETDNLYFIHTIPHLIPNSIEIYDGVFWGGDYEVLFELMKTDQISQTDIRLFLGYAGWDEGQLNDELESRFWTCIVNPFHEHLLQKTPSKLWKELMLELGDEFVIWANAPEDPIMN